MIFDGGLPQQDALVGGQKPDILTGHYYRDCARISSNSMENLY